LGRQSQARHSPRAKKALALSKHPNGATRAGALARPKKAPFPRRGKTCGRREREADAGRREERSSRPPDVATVESTWSAGWRRPSRGDVGAQASVGPSRAQRLLLGVRTHRRQGVLFGRRGGERRRLTPKNAWAPGASALKSTRAKGTRPLLGPKARARQSWLNSRRETVTGSRALCNIAVGQTWATRKNRHRGCRERTERGSTRAAAPARERARYVRKGRRSRPSSLRGLGSSGRSARTS